MEQRLIGILGLGAFGASIARTLEEYDVDVLAIDTNENNVNEVADVVLQAIVGDFTDYDLLTTVGIADCDAVVVASGSTLESSALAVMHLKKLGVPRIICKAKNIDNASILRTVGATAIVMPERETGQRLARGLMRDNIEDVLDLDQSTSIVDFHPPQSWTGKTFEELDIRNKHGINVIGVRKSIDEPLNVNINGEWIIKETDILVGITTNDILEDHDFLSN